MAASKDDRRKELEAELAALDAADDDSDYEIEIGSGDSYARVPYRKGRKFLQDKFGIDLDPEPEAEQEPAEGKKAGGKQQQGGQVRAFQRRIG